MPSEAIWTTSKHGRKRLPPIYLLMEETHPELVDHLSERDTRRAGIYLVDDCPLWHDLLFVEDTVDGFIKIAESTNTFGEVLNLATGKDISIGELAKLICKIIGKELPIETDEQRLRPKNAEVNVLCGDASKVKRLIGWTPKTSLNEGLKKTIEWISKNIDKYKPKEYTI